MPYKERLKQAEGRPRKRRKPGYRVTAARAYNQSLKRRGMISLYFCGGDLKAQFINARTHAPGVSGRVRLCAEGVNCKSGVPPVNLSP